MSTPAKAHEPTMEEILASIRRIISDDEPGAAKPMKPEARTPAPEPEPPLKPEAAAEALGQDDIDAMFASFDSPALAEPEPKVELKAPAPKQVESVEALPPLSPPDDLDVFELTEEMATDPAPVRAPEPPAAAPRPVAKAPDPAPTTADPSPGDRLLSASADDAVSNAFGSLANTILASNARTLDDIVKEMLRPMLRAWLDDNLPPLVERLVRQEIERVARGGR